MKKNFLLCLLLYNWNDNFPAMCQIYPTNSTKSKSIQVENKMNFIISTTNDYKICRFNYRNVNLNIVFVRIIIFLIHSKLQSSRLHYLQSTPAFKLLKVKYWIIC